VDCAVYGEVLSPQLEKGGASQPSPIKRKKKINFKIKIKIKIKIFFAKLSRWVSFEL
jgi:hypothetical protein